MSRGEIRQGLLGTKRTALALYGVLLVLPTLVLGTLHWHQLVLDHETLLMAVPGDAHDAGRRLEEAIGRRLRELVDREDERAFFEYKPKYFPPNTIGADLALVPSKLATGPAPSPIVCWFSYHDERDPWPAPPVLLFGGRAADSDDTHRRDDMLTATFEVRERDAHESIFVRWWLQGRVHSETIALPVLAINLSDEENVDCMRDELPSLRGLQNDTVKITMSDFLLRFYRDPDGTPRVFATRTVSIPKSAKLGTIPACYASIGRSAVLRQGFFIDPAWLFKDLPAILARQVLESSQEFVPAGVEPVDPATVAFRIQPVRDFGFDADAKDKDYGMMRIAVNTKDLESRFRTQTLRFLGMAAMLVVSLGTGLILLLRSVNRDLEAARRTENFVAAVTHELRTPVAAIKLYGEMLEDGWVEDPEKQHEYYRRIVRETGRLETLVENVLEKSQLARREISPEPGDVNQAIESLEPSLLGLAPDGVKDLQFHYADDLPLAMLIPEGVRSIVTNLVENARKYAPVARDAEKIEPILVRTHVLAGAATLDVLDRGPGIPHGERARIFEAFYRVGNETTRTTRGTGLGLHLVALQAQAMGARVAVLDRKGGGTIFRVTFETAPAA